jgi:hypothetical protein
LPEQRLVDPAIRAGPEVGSSPDAVFKLDPSVDILTRAIKGGVMGGSGPQELKGGATLRIIGDGLPKGTRAKVNSFDGLFKKVRLDRGRQMPLAEDT